MSQTKLIQLRPALRRFAEHMEIILQRHDDAKGCWRGAPYYSLMKHLSGEVSEVYEALALPGDNNERIADECADVANMAMMVFDKLHARADDGPDTTTERPLVYLAIPYRHKDRGVVLSRVNLANRAAGKLMNEGFVVYSPISHSHPIADSCALPTDWEFWGKIDHAFISCCNKLFVFTLPGWEQSEGVQAEIKIAEKLGIPIDYLPPDYLNE